MQAPDASQMPSFNAGQAQPAPAFHQDDTPNYNGADQSTPSNFTTSFAPEAITNPAVRQAFEPQIQQDLEQARFAGAAGYRNARLGMSEQELQLRQKAEADRVAAEQAKQQKAMQDAADLQRMKDAGIKTFKGPDGNEYPQTENGKAIYQPITEKDAEVGYFDDKGGYTDNAGNTFTGQPGAALKVTRDRLGNLTPVDPDRNVQAQPWVDDQGKPWLVKQNQHNAWQYIDPNDALNDPKLQKPAAQALWQADKGKNDAALSSAQKAVENSTALIDPDKLGINDKILNAPPKVQINALTPTLQSLQKTVDAGPPPDRGNAWFGLGADRGPDPDALAQYNDAKQGVTALQAHLQNLQDLRDASDQAKALKDGGPSLYLQRAQSEKKNSDDTDAAYAKAGLNPQQIADAKQAMQAVGAIGQANDTYQDLGNAINAGQVAPPDSAQNNSGAVQSPSTAPAQSGQSQAAAPTPFVPQSKTSAFLQGAYEESIKPLIEAYHQEQTNRDINNTPPDQLAAKLSKAAAAQSQAQDPQTFGGKAFQFLGGMAGQAKTILGTAAAGAGVGAAVGSLGLGVGAVPGTATGAGLGLRAGFGLAASQSQHAQTMIDAFTRFKQQGMSDDEATSRALTAANSASNIIAPFVANAAIPGFKGVGKGIVKAVTGAGMEGGFFGASNAASTAVQQNAEEKAGVKYDAGEKSKGIMDSFLSGLGTGAIFHGLHAGIHAADYGLQNQKISADLNSYGSNAKYVQQLASVIQSAKTPQDAAKARETLLGALTPQNKVAVEAHLNAVLDLRQKLAAADTEATKDLPALNSKLSKIPDQQLAIYASGGAHPDDKSAPTPAEATYEINARQAHQDALAANQPVRDALVDVAMRQSDKIKAAAKTPDGQAMLDAVNRANAQRPAGTGAINLDTAQLASDISPKTEPDSNIQPHAVGYLPLAHEIEQIKDPNDRAFASNALKLLNGRHFDESKIDMHDQAKVDSAQKEAQKAVEKGQATSVPEPRHPNDFEARETKEGNPALTEKGLARLRSLVPESRKMLSGPSGEPVTAQHLAEQGGKLDEKAQPKASKKVSKKEKEIKPNPNAQRVPHLAGIEDSRLNQKLSALRANRERLQIAIDAQKKKTGGIPEGLSRLTERHEQAIADHEQEISARMSQRTPPEAQKPQEVAPQSEKQASENDSKTVDAIQDGIIKTPSRSEPGTLVSYGHAGQVAKGEVMAVSFEDHSITVRDPKTGENRNIPFSDIIHEPQEKAPEATQAPAGKASEAVGTQQAEPEREEAAGGTTSVAEPFVVRYDEDGKAVHESSLPGLEGHEIPEDHLEAAKMLTQAYNKYQKVFAALGIKGFTKSSEKRGLGVSVGWENPELVQVNLAKLAEQLKIVGDKGRDAQQRLELAMDEELKHSATLRVAGDDGKGKYEADRAVDTLSKVWQSATKEQKDLVLDLYDKGATHLFAGGKAKDTYGAGLRDAEDTKEWNANRGAEYVRMALQAHADGKVTELESLIKNNTAWDMIKGVIDYLREKLSPTDPTAQKLIADVNDLLRVKHDIDAGQKPEASTPEQKLKRAPRPKKPKVSKDGVSVPDYDKFKTAEYRKVAPPEDIPNAEHSLAPFNKYGERISGKPESILDQEPKDQYDKVVDPETGAIKWNLIKKASEAEKIDFAKRAAQSLGIETTARTYQGLVDAIHEEEHNRRNVVREAIGAAPEDAAQARGWQAAHDYLDEQVRDPRNWKEGLMFGFHDIASVFKSAIRAGSNAVDDLIHKLTAKQPEEGIAVGKGRKETDERHNYIPTKDSPEGVEDRRDMRSAAKGMSAALAYKEKTQPDVVQKAVDFGAKLYQTVKSKAEWLAKISDKLEPILANLDGPEKQNVKSTLFDYVAHGGKDAAVFIQDSLDHMKAVEPSSNPARVKDGRIVRPKIGPETDRVANLIEQARKGENGQSTFVFDDGKGNSARVYTKPDGTSTVRVPDSTIAGTFKGVKEAVQHLVSKGFDLQSSKIERKLAQQEAIARITAMVSQGLKIGQRRFHFSHEDGRIAALHAFKDGTFSVTGYGARQVFKTAKLAANFLHDRGFEMQSSTLEKGLRDRGLHPDQLNEPVPYTDAQKKTIDTYRKAKGLEPLYASAEDSAQKEHPDAVHIGDMEMGDEKLPLFNLKRDVEGHPKHSTVSEETLRKAGINPDEIPRINAAPELPVSDEKRPDRREIPFEVKSDKEQAHSYHNAISRLAAKGDPNPDKTVVDHVSGFLKSVLPTVLKHAKVNEVSTGIGGWFDGEKTQTTPNIVLSLDTKTPEGKQEASDLMRALTQTLHQSQGNVFERSGQIDASHGALTLTLPKDFSDDQVKTLMQELAGLKDSAQNSHLGGFTNFKDKNGNRVMTIGDQFYTPPKGSTFARELNKSLPELDKILKTYNITDRKFQPLKIETHDYEPEATSNQRSGDTGQARPDEVAGPEGGRLSLERGLKRGIGHALDSIHSSAEDSEGVGSPDAGGSEAERRAGKDFDRLGEARALSPKRFFAGFREAVGHEASIEGNNFTVLKWAEEHGLLIPKDKVFGPFNDYEYEGPSLEHYVYFIPKRGRVLKVGSPAQHWGLDKSMVKYLQNLHDQDAITGGYMDYKVLGITRIGGFEPSPVITCRRINGTRIPAGELHERLQDMGWEPVPGRNYTYRDPESRVTIIDAHNGNILKVSRDDKDPGYLMPVDIHIDGDVRKLTEGLKFKPESNSLHASSEAEPFYSHMQKVLEAKMPQRASADQIRGILKGGQVKDDEMKWSGIDDYLKDNPTATKADLLNYLKTESGVKITENRLERTDSRDARLKQLIRDHPEMTMGEISRYQTHPDEAPEDIRPALKALDETPKFEQSSLNLPGGSDYRERVYSLPKKGERSPSDTTGWRAESADSVGYPGQWFVFDENGDKIKGKTGVGLWGGKTKEEAIKEASTMDRRGIKSDYTSSHFPDIPNYLAHSRMDDRVDSEGKPGLFVQEFQSDRHQQGREHGYKEDSTPLTPEEIKEDWNRNLTQQIDQIKNNMEDAQRSLFHQIREQPKDVVGAERLRSKFTRLGKQKAELEKQLDRPPANYKGMMANRVSDLVPDAPFRQTKQWAGFLFRRALAEAIQGGKKWIGWTDGATQAERYDLSKHIDDLRYLKRPDGKYSLMANKDGSQVMKEHNIPANELSGHIGKELAQKIINGEGDNVKDEDGDETGAKQFLGLDLKVGGEGMKTFYDQILPSYVKEYAKKWGVKPELSDLGQGAEPKDEDVIKRATKMARADGLTERFSDLEDDARHNYLDAAQKEIEAENTKTKIWKLPITDEMRDSIKQHGQPLFAGAEDSAQKEEDPFGLPVADEQRKGITKSLQHMDKAEALVKRGKPENWVPHFIYDIYKKAMSLGGLNFKATDRNIGKASELLAHEVLPYYNENPKVADYYHSDGELSNEYVKQAMPDVTDDELILHKIAAGLMSPNTSLYQSALEAIKVLSHWKAHDGFKGLKVRESENPKNPAGYKIDRDPIDLSGSSATNKARSLLALEKIYNDPEIGGSWQKVKDYLTEPVSKAELQKANEHAGYSGQVGDIGACELNSKLAGNEDGKIPCGFIFGAKVGSYVLNLLGEHKYTTVDIWDSRLVKSYFPELWDNAKGEPAVGGPQSVEVHKFILKFDNEFVKAFEELSGTKLSAAAAQALRWFFAIDKFKDAGYSDADTEGSFSANTKRALQSALNDRPYQESRRISRAKNPGAFPEAGKFPEGRTDRYADRADLAASSEPDRRDSKLPVGLSASPEAKSLSKEALGFDSAQNLHAAPEELKAFVQGAVDVKDALRRTWLPDARGPEAAIAARSGRAALAKADLLMNQVRIGTNRAHAYLDRQTPEYNLKLIDSIEQGRLHPDLKGDAKAESIIEMLKSTNNRFRDMVRHMPNSHFQAYIENYFPHIFADEDVPKVQQWIKSKIEGSTSFLKHRTIPTVAEALDMGFKLASDNPVDLFLTRWSQMSQYMAGQEWMNDLREQGIAKPFKNESEIPLGNRRVDDRLGLSTVDQKGPDGKVVRIRQGLFAPDTVVDLLDNHLSPGLRNRKGTKAIYKVISGLANTMNSAQLGLSAFHLGFTTLDMGVSKMAYALEEAHRGNYGTALGAGTLGVARGLLSPLELAKGAIGKAIGKPEWDTHPGSRLFHEMDFPGSQDPVMGQIAHAVTQGGGLNRMDEFYANQSIKKFLTAWRQGNKFGQVWHALPAAIELSAKPIMEYIVPRQKLAVFYDLAKMEMRDLGPNASTDDVRKAMQKVWASVDNRMGQLRYDNLFWNKTAKDTLMLGVRSVGWNLGSYREILGGGLDAARFAQAKLTGKEAEFTHRMAYVLGLHMLVGSIGAMINYLYTGQGPQELRDYFFPKTGQKDGGGHDIRLALPSYIKDEAAFIHDPQGTIVNKASPIISSMAQIWRNSDYYGTEIRHHGDDPLTQGADLLGFATKQFMPFAFTNAQQLKQQGASAGTSLLPEIGITPAAKWISKSAAEEKADDILNAQDQGTRTQAQFEADQAKSQVKQQLAANDPLKGGDSAKFNKILRDAIQNKIIPASEMDRTLKQIRMTPLQREFESIRDLPQAIEVWKAATSEEKVKLMPLMQKKIAKARESGQKFDGSLLKLSN